MKHNFFCLLVGFLSILSTLSIPAQVAPDPTLLTEINKIKAIDNHAHPLPFLKEGEKDVEFDVPESIPPLAPPVRLRPTNPEYLEAWSFLYGYKYKDTSNAHMRELLALKRRVMNEKGDAYPAWVLDRLGIETMLTNRISLGRGQKTQRFRWVWHTNPLLFPLNNEEAKKSNPQREAGFTTDERWLKDFIAEVGLTKLPDSLDGYLSQLVVPLLERRKRDGAIAVKFYAAYMRSLDFTDVPESDARQVYGKYIKGGVPSGSEYKALQDFLFRRIALECGRIGLAVHIHVGAGAGGYFYNSTANPFLLDSVLNDPNLRKTTFVLIHGGLPFAQATRFLLGKPNVYADFSSQTFLTSTRELSGVIRSWLEFFPEKVLFGTDAYPLTTTVGWEEIGWLTNRSARQALALALTDMMNDGEITRQRASELARMVMRDNAIKLYGLKTR
ncbi:MAG: amidohydrolase [Acidobacteria bacterium]|nr:amidohydrolase [Acidobacteriota bacterium]MCA1639771.1 amidohydrolase [Acidobacteriota bacterium]